MNIIFLLLPTQLNGGVVHLSRKLNSDERARRHREQADLNEYCAPLAPLIGWSQRAFALKASNTE
jgi:hypothetical protein